MSSTIKKFVRGFCGVVFISFICVHALADVDTNVLVNSAIRVFCKKSDGIGTGSGFLVGGSGKFVLTNSHVVDGCEQLVVLSPKGPNEVEKIQARLVWDSKTSVGKRHLDAALIELASSSGQPGVKFASKATVALNDKVIAVGYPGAADSVGGSDALVKPTITNGTISRMFLRRAEGGSGATGVGVYQITAAISPGNSGGPLFNQYGEVIAINTEKSLVATAGLSENGLDVVRVPLGEGIAWSQETDELLPILRENGIEITLRTERRNWFWAWVDRDPVTAGGIGVIVLLMLMLGAYFASSLHQTVHIDDPIRDPKNPERKGRARVRGLSGPYAGAKLDLDSDLVFGRDPQSCAVVFLPEFNGISSRHCSLRFDKDKREFFLRDLGSTNHTYAKGRQLEPNETVSLRSGDEFYLFKPKYKFVVELDSVVAGKDENATEGHWQHG